MRNRPLRRWTATEEHRWKEIRGFESSFLMADDKSSPTSIKEQAYSLLITSSWSSKEYSTNTLGYRWNCSKHSRNQKKWPIRELKLCKAPTCFLKAKITRNRLNFLGRTLIL